jgi:diguanylate cyclase (GGDEF)-like protein/PAS domain S-box-containing protein
MSAAIEPRRFKERISVPLVRILRVYVALITSLVMGLTVLAAYLQQSAEVGHERQRVLTRLVSEITSQAGEISALATSPLLWTGLTDSQGREVYLAPLLERFNRSGARRFYVLDYRGRVFIAPNTEPPAVASVIASDPVVVAAVQQGRDGFGLQAIEGGVPQVLLVHRILNPNTDGAVGYIVAVIDVPKALSLLRLESDVALSLAIGDSALTPEPAGGWLISGEAAATASDGEMDVPVRVWVGQPIYTAAGFVAAGLLVALLLGWSIIERVKAWADRFATATAQRLDRLLLECQAIVEGRRLTPIDPGPDDELSQVTLALNSMLVKQRQFMDELRTTAQVFAMAAEGIMVTDPDGRIVEANAALLTMTGYARADLLGRPAGTLYRKAVDLDVGRQMAVSLSESGRWSGETLFLGRSGQLIPASVALSRIQNDEGEVLGNVTVITDISRLKKIEHQLRDLANRDALTGLPNFRYMSEQVQSVLQEAQAQSRRWAVLFLDLDRFKAVNDELGHDAGDTVVKSLATHLTQQLPGGHLLCRRSGDEFIAMIERSETDDEALTQMLNRLTPLEVSTEAGMVRVTATLGVSRFPEDATNWHDLQICADVAMNEAKQERRGSLVWYDDRIGRRLYRRRQIQARLREAIQARAFDVHYQPEVDLRTGRVIGFEALARWQDSELGTVSPTEFIAAAEEGRMMDVFTLCIAEKVLQDKPRLQARFPQAVVAFNASPQVFRRSRLLDFLSDWSLREPGILEGLEIELTETEITRSNPNLQTQMQALVGLGVRLAIDDFGTGYSSLSRLTQFPISRLKIDRAFVQGMERTRELRIARLIVDLAKALGLDVTAEGVETVEQREALLRMGCHRGQGWLFARAMPASELLASDNPVNFPSE